MKKRIRRYYRNFLAMVIRYYRWKYNPKNADVVLRLNAYNQNFRLL